VLLSLEPAIASIIGWTLLHQSISPLQGLAIAVVIAASIIATLGQTTTSAPDADAIVTNPDATTPPKTASHQADARV
jgi:hypothetical protein